MATMSTERMSIERRAHLVLFGTIEHFYPRATTEAISELLHEKLDEAEDRVRVLEAALRLLYLDPQKYGVTF